MERNKVAIIGNSQPEMRRAISAALYKSSAEGLPKPVEIPSRFKASPTMRVNFGNGKVVAMNRRERRRQHLYGDRLTVTKRRPSPPPIFHSLEEQKDSQR